MSHSVKQTDKNESGNVLFLILIAVALFAALSYAVTSSTRNSAKNSGRETNLISSAQITQYPSSIATAIVRMTISGESVEDIRFNAPSEFEELSNPSLGVFHPNGGAATHMRAPSDIMLDGEAGNWIFNAEMEVNNIGLTEQGGNDIIAFLPGIKKAICARINEEYGLGDRIPRLDSNRDVEYMTRMVDDGVSDYEFPTIDVPDIDDGDETFYGQPFGCFQNGGGDEDYVYYHVIVER